jgi:hypothetical protein
MWLTVKVPKHQRKQHSLRDIDKVSKCNTAPSLFGSIAALPAKRASHQLSVPAALVTVRGARALAAAVPATPTLSAVKCDLHCCISSC